MDCPYYVKVQDVSLKNFVKGYCQGRQAGGMIVPSIREEKSCCLNTNGHLKCLIYLSKLAPSPCSELRRGPGIDPERESLC